MKVVSATISAPRKCAAEQNNYSNKHNFKTTVDCNKSYISIELGPCRKEEIRLSAIAIPLMDVDPMKWQSVCYYSKHETRAYVQSGEEVAVVVGVVYACSFLR